MPAARTREKHLITREGAPAGLKGLRRVLDKNDVMPIAL